ncbi:GNAT family N-acetyltransferase [Pacificoceanicola onchidii]|uniref:GNAT family N-acetyltransferase n=1 Tax=Pacificoceanicola onchidii TaxID=2562685 RepID=UPI0010A517C0|nr:hypothetical protein [Pacificoceanicola onchidii]
MIRQATPDDAGAIAVFLEPHIETSMFLLGNLELHGIGNTTHPHGTTYFLRETGDGITGVFGCANAGFLMCQLPGLTTTEAQTYAHLLQGYTLRGMTGAAEQVDLILEALPVDREAFSIFRSDPLYSLDLAALPKTEAEIRPPLESDAAMLRAWMADYMRATGIALDPKADAIEEQVQAALTTGRHRLLIEDGAPTALTGINARAGGAVQVGGVFVPEENRGKGRAGRAVLAHLQELKPGGVTRAILFAAAPEAAKAYERIGFERCGDYRVALLAEPTQLGTPR